MGSLTFERGSLEVKSNDVRKCSALRSDCAARRIIQNFFFHFARTISTEGKDGEIAGRAIAVRVTKCAHDGEEEETASVVVDSHRRYSAHAV